MLIALFASVWAGDLDAMLARGEVTLLETHADGRLRQVTAIALVRRPIAEVWARLIDFDTYERWMPGCADATVVSTEGGEVVVDWTVSVLGPDVRFREAMKLDAERHVVDGRWVSGALPGSRWAWRLEARGADTIVRREVHTTVVDSSWLVRQAEDDHHTLEYGINVASGVVELRGLKVAMGVP